jgi:hypothetical protein
MGQRSVLAHKSNSSMQSSKKLICRYLVELVHT